MSDANPVLKKWEDFERTEPRFSRLYERDLFINDLCEEALKSGSVELAEKLRFELQLSRLVSRTLHGTSHQNDSEWRDQARLHQLVERLKSPSVVVRATAARALWDIDRALDKRAGRKAAEAYLEWFKRSGDRAVKEQSPDWMMQANGVARAAGTIARQANAQDLEAQFCDVIIAFAKAAVQAGLGDWLHVCADVLSQVHGQVLGRKNLSEVVTLLERQAVFARAAGIFHLEQEFIRKTAALKHASGMSPNDASWEGALAESYEREALAGPSAMHRAHVLRDAVEAYRRARRPEDAVRAAKLLESATEASRRELKPMSFTVRFPQEKVDALFKQFEIPLDEALVRIAIHPVFELDPVSIERQAESNARASPLLSLVPIRVLGPEGTDYGPSTPQERKAYGIHRAASEQLGFRLPFLAEIFRRLKARGLDRETVHRSLSRGEVFLQQDIPFLDRGVCLWLAGDHLSAIHVIAPLLEKVLRRLSRALNSPTVRVREEGLEQLSINGVLEKLEGRIEPSLHFELKFVLAEKGGWALRHAVAHGLEDATFYDEMKGAYLMRLVLRIGALEFVNKDSGEVVEDS